MVHHLDELRAVALLEARIGLDLGRDGARALLFVVVRGKHLELGVELQDPVEEAVVERLGIAGRQIGASRPADQERVAREEAIAREKAHRIARVARRVDRLHPDAADHEHVAVLQAQVRKGRRAVAEHHDGHAELPGDLVRRREMIGVRVRVDHVAKRQAAAREAAVVVIDLADLGIDQRGDARIGTADEIRLAAARCDLLEDHRRSHIE